ARGPVERVLQNAGHAVIVLGRDDDQAVAAGDFLPQGADGRRGTLAVLVRIVERNVVQREDGQLRLGAEGGSERLQNRHAVGLAADAAGKAEKADGLAAVVGHGGSRSSFRPERRRRRPVPVAAGGAQADGALHEMPRIPECRAGRLLPRGSLGGSGPPFRRLRAPPRAPPPPLRPAGGGAGSAPRPRTGSGGTGASPPCR